MAFLVDLIHIIAATLLAVVGLGYEREEECDPVHYQSIAYIAVDESGSEAAFAPASAVSECDSRDAAVVYPVL